jgi:DNA repair exonuclease SbcCD ATPase subunit
MDRNDNENFRIRLDEDPPRVELPDEENLEEEEDLEDLEELEEFEPPPSSPTNRKLYFLIALVLIFTAFGIWAVYQIIQQGVRTDLDEGATAVSNISKQVDAQLTALSALQKDLENKLADKLEKLESRTGSLGNKISKMEKTVAEIDKSKADKKDMTHVLADVGNRIAPVQASFDGLKSDLSALKSDLTGFKTDIAGIKTDMAGLNGNLQKEISLARTGLDSQAKVIESLRNDFSALSADVVDKKTLNSAIIDEGKRLDERTAKLKKDMEFILYKIRLMEERLPAPGDAHQSSGNSGGGKIVEQPLE